MACDLAYLSIASLRLARPSLLDMTSLTSCAEASPPACRKAASTSFSASTGASRVRGRPADFGSGCCSAAGAGAGAALAPSLAVSAAGACPAAPALGMRRNWAMRSALPASAFTMACSSAPLLTAERNSRYLSFCPAPMRRALTAARKTGKLLAFAPSSCAPAPALAGGAPAAAFTTALGPGGRGPGLVVFTMGADPFEVGWSLALATASPALAAWGGFAAGAVALAPAALALAFACRCFANSALW
mmetsp:Transcript_98240/g.305512  ORF Transcript_98240/g.305512 Transcript_98240/m.305512 type:complete len:246 (+) Transcript_98240:593-1330(+)